MRLTLTAANIEALAAGRDTTVTWLGAHKIQLAARSIDQAAIDALRNDQSAVLGEITLYSERTPERRYYSQSLNEDNVEDLAAELARLRANDGRLDAIVDEHAGIIAYALGAAHTALIVEALNGPAYAVLGPSTELARVLEAAELRAREVLDQASKYERLDCPDTARETLEEHFRPLRNAIEAVRAANAASATAGAAQIDEPERKEQT
jgi:hypothetical protein